MEQRNTDERQAEELDGFLEQFVGGYETGSVDFLFTVNSNVQTEIFRICLYLSKLRESKLCRSMTERRVG